MKLLHITTVPMSLTFLRGQVAYMRQRGFEVVVMSSPGQDLEDFGRSEDVQAMAVSLTRAITPLRDIVALWRIRQVIRRTRPTILHAHTPKAGFLGLIAVVGTGTRARLYHMRGLPFLTCGRVRRMLLKLTERVSCRLADRVLCNSHSVRAIAIEEKLCSAEKSKVLLNGSGNGVDAESRFNPVRFDAKAREKVRSEFGIPPEATVVGFVGRLANDKGIRELAGAWASIRETHPGTFMLIVGPLDDRDRPPGDVMNRMEADPRVRLTGMEWDTPPLYAAMDLVVLPTYREGFPNVALEAAAMSLPVVISMAPGCADAIVEAETGTFVAPGDVDGLVHAIRSYLEDPGLRRRHGSVGRERVLRDFRPLRMWEAIHAEYQDLLSRVRLSPIKRAMDLGISVIGGIVLFPICAAVAFLVWIKMGRPIFFRQERPGYLGRPFTMYKFRTMGQSLDEDGVSLPDEHRITSLGKFLRRSSLDELPELWNVVKGEMSLVGPRPLLTEYLPLYTPSQARRHLVRPGITGWAQINGRNDTTWEKRLSLDNWYVENRSMRLDLEILLRTLWKVVEREGISQEGVATMTRFRGTAI